MLGTRNREAGRVESPLSAWLELQCRTIAGTEAGMVVVGSSEHAASADVARWPPAGAPSSQLSVAIESALEKGRLVRRHWR